MLWFLFKSALWLLSALVITSVVKWLLSGSTEQGPGKDSHSHARSSSSSSSRPQNGQHWSGPPNDEDQEEDEQEESSSFTGGVRLNVIKVAGASGEVARILESRDYYSVLEVARTSEATEIKKAYRTKQMATHPDKNQGVPGALEASQRVNLAFETLGDEIRRRQYDVRLTDEEQYGPRSRGKANGMPRDMSELAKSFDEFVRETMPPPPPGAHYPTIDPSAYDPWGDAPDHTYRMACPCGYDHMATKVPDRTWLKARLCRCQSCGSFSGSWLPARDNDMWFESTNRVLSQVSPENYIRAYRCVGKAVYDVTPWAKCHGMLVDASGTPAPCNVHYIRFRFSGDSPKKSAKKQQDPNYGFNQFKGKGNTKRVNNKKKKKKK